MRANAVPRARWRLQRWNEEGPALALPIWRVRERATQGRKGGGLRARGIPWGRTRWQSAGVAGQDAEEGLDVGVGAAVTVAVEVGRAAGRAAGAAEAGKEGLDVGVVADIPIAVEVRGARGRPAEVQRPPHDAPGVAPAAVLDDQLPGPGAVLARERRERVL